jgi:hypothetical protein
MVPFYMFLNYGTHITENTKKGHALTRKVSDIDDRKKMRMGGLERKSKQFTPSISHYR